MGPTPPETLLEQSRIACEAPSEVRVDYTLWWIRKTHGWIVQDGGSSNGVKGGAVCRVTGRVKELIMFMTLSLFLRVDSVAESAPIRQVVGRLRRKG